MFKIIVAAVATLVAAPLAAAGLTVTRY